MSNITDFIVEYWLQTLLTLISGGLAFMVKKFYDLYQKEKNHQKTKEQKQFYDDLKQAIKEASAQSRTEETNLQNQIDAIKYGVLSIQGKIFKDTCRDYLKPDKEFTLEEFESLQAEHDVYNALGGNHTGDSMFDLVKKKADNILTDDR